jgi:uncharacterized membrane protein YdjX (TVP38/TMEM64 family)
LAEPAGGVSRAALGATLKGLLMLALLVAAALAARHLGTGVLRAASPDARGALIVVVLGGVLAAAGVPRQAVAFACGYVFGAWRGGALALAAQMLGCAIDFYLARLAARGVTSRLGARLARLDALLAARPFSATLTLRLLPVGNNMLLNLVAGVSALRASAFFAASLIGYVPQTAIFALAGSGVHVNHATQLLLGAALFAVSAALGCLLLRRQNA